MKFFFISIIAIFSITISNAQTYTTYSDGVRDGIAKVDEIKQILLNSGFASWGFVATVRVREITSSGALGAVYLYPSDVPAGSNWVFVYGYSWTQSSFNSVAYSDVSTQTYLNYLQERRFDNDYWAGQFAGFTNYWFFDDYQ